MNKSKFSIRTPKTPKSLPIVHQSVQIDVLKAIKRGANNLQIVNITYRDEKGLLSIRDTEPYEIKNNKYVAFCLERQAIRTFHLGNIMQAAVLPIKYRPRYPVKIFV